MKFFIDSANLEQIRSIQELGLLDGVTTNPSLMAKEGINNVDEHYQAICKITEGDVSAEVLSTSYEEMVQEGRHLAKLATNIVVKVPMTFDGLKAIRTLKQEGIRTNCTLVFTPIQALLAAKAGATYVSPFIGRLDDISSEGIKLIRQIKKIFRNYQLPTYILAASIRHTLHVVQVALAGADYVTIPYPTFISLVKHPLTDIGLEKFLKDANKI
ncbi:MAG: fructose-6-phosphate aldolase [Bacteroidia bacterium]|nr:fructose-6-phosphate aldolase [Bacteroidia bacterium]MDW8158251.1 fructose-6-phosphate aldolase [Bacteroidia bacterium]